MKKLSLLLVAFMCWALTMNAQNLAKNSTEPKANPKVAMNEADKAALTALYNATDGANWTDNTNWLTGDGSDWYGITLDANGRVTEINLSRNNLINSIPTEIGNLTNLTSLNLDFNQLIGTIPTQIWDLTNLTKLYLRGYYLTGTIPAEIGNLVNLIELDLGGNQLTGTIPIEIGNLINLTKLSLWGNELTGTVPTQISNLINLTRLYLEENKLTGLPNLSALTNLSSGYIYDNKFDFGDLETSNISWRSYSPQANVAITKNESGGNVTLSVNVTGTNNTYKWLKDDVEINGETTNTLTVANIADGVYYCEITNINYPDLTLQSVAEGIGSSSFTQGVETTEYNALIAIYDATAGNNWSNNTNWKSSEAVNFWNGVTVTGGRITGIHLYSNNLINSIPTEIGSLVNLTTLSLSGNQLTSLPDLSTLTNLTYASIKDNQLDFGDLETSNITWSSYTPQAKVGTEQNIGIETGANETLSVAVNGTNNTYQWYKDNVEIAGATATDYTISNFAEATHTGVYVCKIKDTNYPDLTLESNTITVSKATSTAIENTENAHFNIFPNPTKDILKLEFSSEKPEMIKVLDLTGKLLISKTINAGNETINLSNFDDGIYILQLKFADKIISTKVVKN